MSLLSNNLIRDINAATKTETKTTVLATVTEIDDDKVYLTYYGEDTQSQKPTKRLSSYTPAVDDTVLVAVINGSYVITGKVV